MIPGVLFDLDGTLIATRRLYLECYRRALNPVFGRHLTDEELIALHKGPTSELGMLRAHIPPDQLEACLQRFYEEYDALHESHFEGIYDGVPTLLDALRAAGHHLAIITGKSRRAWQISNARVKLGEFASYVFDDDVATPKPDPEGILRALDELRLKPAQACYVGDSRGDLLAAAAAGVTPVAALWSKAPADRAAFAAFAAAHDGLSAVTPYDLLTLLSR
jgi:phosphoglycolate phosphatase/pyrophosphatase PpaX